MFSFMLQVDPVQSYLNLKIGLPPVLKAGSSGTSIKDLFERKKISFPKWVITKKVNFLMIIKKNFFFPKNKTNPKKRLVKLLFF